MSNETTLLFGLLGVTVRRVEGASDGSRRPRPRVRLASSCSSSSRPSNSSAYPNKRSFLGAGSRSSVHPVVAPSRSNRRQRSASGRSFSLTPQGKPRFRPDSRSTKIVGADGSSPPSDTLFVQVTGLRHCFWCPHGCTPQTLKRTDAFPSRHINMLVPAWSPSGRRALASALSPIARMTRSSTDPDIATLPRNLLAGQFSHAAPVSRHYGKRWGLWQHKFAGLRTRCLPMSGSS
jgi:hypothetical protein